MMTKPVIVTRAAKGSPLTRTELDNNFANIDNATIGVSDGTNSGSLNLNDQLNFAASGSATVAYNSSTKTLTVGATAGASLPSNASGFLKNDGSGNLSWASAGGGLPTALIFMRMNAQSSMKFISDTENLKFYDTIGLTITNSDSSVQYQDQNSTSGTQVATTISLPVGSYYISYLNPSWKGSTNSYATWRMCSYHNGSEVGTNGNNSGVTSTDTPTIITVTSDGTEENDYNGSYARVTYGYTSNGTVQENYTWGGLNQFITVGYPDKIYWVANGGANGNNMDCVIQIIKYA